MFIPETIDQKMSCQFSLIVFATCICVVIGQTFQIDNELEGPVSANCYDTSVTINFKTKKFFTGRAYIKGKRSVSHCSHDFSKEKTTEASMGLPFDECDSEKKRMAADEGIKRIVTVVISFHSIFETKADRAIRVECNYYKLDYKLTAGLSVSMLPTEVQESQQEVPACRYTLHRDSPNGEIVDFAKIGDTIVHKWTCNTVEHAMLVHSCAVKAEQMPRVALLNEKGCAKDPNLIPNLNYSANQNQAWVETFVFRFQDLNSLMFECEVDLCLKSEMDCQERTPPDCSGPTRLKRNLKKSERSSDTSLSFLLQSPKLYVADMKPNNNTDWKADRNRKLEVCYTGNTLLLFGCTSFAIMVLSVVTVFSLLLVFRKSEEEEKGVLPFHSGSL